MNFDHAEHNESLCDQLITLTGYNDWVLTTAFYSALHFANSKMFPLEIENIIYSDIDHYSASLSHSSTKSYSEKKHTLTKILVKEYLKSISYEYRWLFDTCLTARYHNYKIDDKIARKARKYLTKIKEVCIKVDETKAD